jgi:hypothetical protein
MRFSVIDQLEGGADDFASAPLLLFATSVCRSLAGSSLTCPSHLQRIQLLWGMAQPFAANHSTRLPRPCPCIHCRAEPALRLSKGRGFRPPLMRRPARLLARVVGLGFHIRAQDGVDAGLEAGPLCNHRRRLGDGGAECGRVRFNRTSVRLPSQKKSLVVTSDLVFHSPNLRSCTRSRTERTLHPSPCQVESFVSRIIALSPL